MPQQKHSDNGKDIRTTKRQDGLQRVGKNKWLLYFGLYETESGTYEYRHTFTHKPTLDEIKKLVWATIDAETKDKIVNQFEYEGIKVWLTDEKQRNFASIENNESVTFPLTLKLNEKADATPIYHTFQTRGEFKKFSEAAACFILETIRNGWKEKDNVDWDVFDM